MNRKGFTLAELLGVIVLLSIISMIAIGTVDKNIKEGRQKTCETQEANIKEAAKTWLIDNPYRDEYPFSITIKDLQNAGYLDDDFKNPMTEENYKEGTEVKISKDGNNYTYDIIYANDDKGCE